MADPGKRAKTQRGVAPPEAGGGGIGALPDEALHHVLSFLPAEEAVRTCLIARRWRHLWKYATGLRIGCGKKWSIKKRSIGCGDGNMEKLREFVNHLLLLRKRDSSLDTCELTFFSDIWSRGHYCCCVNLWIRHVVDCQVRMLRLEIRKSSDYAKLDDVHLVSQHLTTLVLFGVTLPDNFLNFSSCPYLEDLQIANCIISTSKPILAESLKRLSITNDTDFDTGPHTLICVPSLVSLRIDTHFKTVPILGRMPSLQEAFVREDICSCEEDDEYYCFACNDTVELDNKCFLLEGLSKAENLALMSEELLERVVFIRDLEWCPTFSNLRTLLLNECWCRDPDFHALTCILKHSPVLEKLTLQLFSKGPEHNVEMIGRCHQIERSATITKLLKTIKVKCKVVDEKVLRVLKFLSALGISFIFK